jgi:N-carbamoyl-L-amino-acid hydrolase
VGAAGPGLAAPAGPDPTGPIEGSGPLTAGSDPSIGAGELGALLADLVPIGRDEAGATTRLAWTREDEEAAAWFARRAEAIGRRMERDPAGNLWACPDTPPPWWAAGSHLDTVRDGGRFDGALGVAAAFAVAERLPVAVISFADEEGARFNTPTFGSRALTGRLDVDDALARVDAHGVALGDAMAAAGVDPERLAEAPAWLDRLSGFLELHVDQTRDVAAARAPAGVVTRLAARLRLQVELAGRADHAGTTPREERHDALAAAARVIVRADTEAASRLGMVFTAARIEVEPNAPTTVPSRAALWLDARAPEPDVVESWRESVVAEAAEVAREAGVRLELRTAAWSPGTAFPEDVRERLLRGLPPGAPRLVCYAGHDAGVIAARRPAGMVLVRNETGISHSPEEDVSLDDAAVAATALLEALS